jgi:hypothetical protein
MRPARRTAPALALWHLPQFGLRGGEGQGLPCPAFRWDRRQNELHILDRGHPLQVPCGARRLSLGLGLAFGLALNTYCAGGVAI